MKLLLTNDDGINSEGLRIVAEWAKSIGEVTVCAPKYEQSGKSHSINIHTPFEVERVDYMEGVRAFSVDSTPADCVRFATLGLKENYDLVISGVNRGFNLGEDIMYSATNGAVFETSTRGLKGIAMSTYVKDFNTASNWLDRIYNFLVRNDVFKFGDIFNINIPENPIDILITKQGGAYFTDDFIDLGNGTWRQSGYCIHKNNHDLSIDTDATIDGHITVTPLTIGRTNYNAYEWLKDCK